MVASGSKPLTPAQQLELAQLSGDWRIYHNRQRLGISQRLAERGLIEVELLPGASPQGFRVRLTPYSPAGGK